MEKTNFTFVRALRWMMSAVVLLFGINLSAQSLTCNNGVQASVDPTLGACQLEITADMILEGSLNGPYDLTITSGFTQVYSGPSPAALSGVQNYVGETLVVTVSNGSNSCWGTINVEDKTAPVFTLCSALTVDCDENLPSINSGVSANDNCTSIPAIDIQLTDETTLDNDICPDDRKIIRRTYVAFDNQGNQSAPCEQLITINRVAPEFPEDIIWSCEQYDNHANIIDPTRLTCGNLSPNASLGGGLDGTVLPVSGGCLTNTGSGVPLVDADACNYAVSNSDEVLPTCGYDASLDEPVFKIVRTWTVLDWCTGNVIASNNSGDNVQVIKVLDVTEPTVNMMPISLSPNVPGAHPQPCKSTGFIPAPGVLSDNCTRVTSLAIFTPAGELDYVNNDPFSGGFIPAPGLAVGNYSVTYQATDACGNIREIQVPLEIKDDIAPAAICDEITDVNLSSDGYAVVNATVFDDGSSDNCCIDRFEVRKMDEDLCDDDDDENSTANEIFGESVSFCCDELGTNPIMVVMRVWDCYDNSNTCMVEVNLQDKLPPTTICPPDVTIDCERYFNEFEAQLALGDLEILNPLGVAQIHDNCEAIIEHTVTNNLDQCAQGEILRNWDVTDPSGNASQISRCTQRVTVDHVSDWAVTFPDDVIYECDDSGVTPEFGEPILYYETCELLAVSYEDELFTTVPDACYKIVRQWTVINWCTAGDEIQQEVVEPSECQSGLNYDGIDNDCTGDTDLLVRVSDRTFRENQGEANNSQGNPTNEQDGYITYQQVIKVNDSVDPVFTSCPDQEVCIFDDCFTSVVLEGAEATDCSDNISYKVESTTLFNGSNFVNGAYTNIVPGTYTANYKATDNCGNWSVCQATITVTDCKKPTPYCKEGIIVGIMNTPTPMIAVWASDLDDGSFDNCGVKSVLISRLDENGNWTTPEDEVTFFCEDLGEQPVQLWITDIFDNQDYCETFVIIQDQMGNCTDDLVTVGGAVANEDEVTVNDVTVELSGQSNDMTTTGTDGTYGFNVPMGNDITITPSKDVDHLNGVTTFDIVKISKHILGTESLDSPYKIIAADANRSESVTTIDIVQIRKLILQINTEFTNNTSWRFVDKDHVFMDASNPWATPFPEVINFNNIDQAQLDVDFVAVKIGDVNMSAATNNLLGADDRNANGTFALNVQDRIVKAGETVTVDFTATQEVEGYQFTLNHTDALTFVETVDGVANEDNFGYARLSEKALLTSWNGAGIDGQVAFSVVFKANNDVMLSEALTANSRFTAAEAYDATNGLLDVELNFNAPATASFELYQNTPNPFNGETVIGFNLPEAGAATLTVTDMSGKVLSTIDGDYAKGYNQVRLANLPATGVLYYTLATANETATKKMVATK